MDGIPASNSIIGFNTLCIRSLASSARYMDTAMPTGVAMAMATRLTSNVPSNNDRVPNNAAGVAVGNHSLPKKKDPGVTLSTDTFLQPDLGTYCCGRQRMSPGSCASISSIFDDKCS